ncbi:MAG: Hpt domain-containing protein [Proteobacteria bacterium]|nr:MAG: Hpt domain-containing protein [Pseudomonadota bacterium]
MIGGDISADQVPLIDHEKLDAVKELAEPGDADGFFRDLVELFFSRVPILIGEMVDANAKGDPVAVSKSAHTLKGTAGNLGAIRVMKLAESLETLGRSGSLDTMSQLLSEIESAFVLSKAELENNMTIPM